MTVIVVLILLALVVGIGGIIKGLLWAILIGIVLLVAALVWAFRAIESLGRRQ